MSISADAQYYLPQHTTSLKTSMCFCRVGEQIFRTDRYLQLRRFDSRVQTIELIDSGDVAVKGHVNTEPRFRGFFHAIQIRDTPSAVPAQPVDATLQPVATDKSEHGVDTFWCNTLDGSRYVSTFSVYDRIGA